MPQSSRELHLADNDFLIKLARWDQLDAFLQILDASSNQVRVIATLRTRTGIAAGKPNLRLLGTHAAAQRLDAFLRRAGPPTPLDHEFLAKATGIQDLDHGEVVLLAALCAGAGQFFFTGDKRAIAALSAFTGTPFDPKLRGRVLCLEQVLYRIIDQNGIGTLRQCICSDLAADDGVANMLVGGAQTPEASFKAALGSECRRLHQASGGLLYDYPTDLSLQRTAAPS